MSEPVIVIGASGHGKVIADIVLQCGDTLLGFLDDSEALPHEIAGIPVLGKVADYAKYPLSLELETLPSVKGLYISLAACIGIPRSTHPR